jgi:hypothetical protein
MIPIVKADKNFLDAHETRYLSLDGKLAQGGMSSILKVLSRFDYGEDTFQMNYFSSEDTITALEEERSFY